MRSFPTLRDAEIAYSQLEQRIALLERNTKSIIGTASPSTPAGKPFSAGDTPAPAFDIDSTKDNNKIIHYLEHDFRNFVNIRRDLSVYPTIWILQDPNQLNAGWSLGINEFSTYKDLVLTKNPTGFFPTRNVLTFKYDHTIPEAWIYTDGNIEPVNTVTHDIGASGKLYRKIYVRDMQIPTATPPTIGDVLTALDASGNVGWAAGGGSIDYLTADSTLNLALTTSYQDIPGTTLSLNKNGYWLILGQITAYKANLDTLISGIISFGAGGVSLGYLGELAGTAMDYYGTIHLHAVVQVTAQPENVVLRAIKASGTGFSQTINNGCKITAVYLKP